MPCAIALRRRPGSDTSNFCAKPGDPIDVVPALNWSQRSQAEKDAFWWIELTDRTMEQVQGLVTQFEEDVDNPHFRLYAVEFSTMPAPWSADFNSQGYMVYSWSFENMVGFFVEAVIAIIKIPIYAIIEICTVQMTCETFKSTKKHRGIIDYILLAG